MESWRWITTEKHQLGFKAGKKTCLWWITRAVKKKLEKKTTSVMTSPSCGVDALLRAAQFLEEQEGQPYRPVVVESLQLSTGKSRGYSSSDSVPPRHDEGENRYGTSDDWRELKRRTVWVCAWKIVPSLLSLSTGTFHTTQSLRWAVGLKHSMLIFYTNDSAVFTNGVLLPFDIQNKSAREVSGVISRFFLCPRSLTLMGFSKRWKIINLWRV